MYSLSTGTPTGCPVMAQDPHFRFDPNSRRNAVSDIVRRFMLQREASLSSIKTFA